MKQGWEIKKLGEVGTFQRGGGFLKSDFVENGFPCIHYGQIHTRLGVKTYKHLTCITEELAFSKSKIAHSGDVIIAITSEDVEGSCKCTAWLGGYDVAVGAHAAIYRHNLNPAFVAYYFNGAHFNFEKTKYTRGFKVVEIKPSDIEKISIKFPSLEEQERIVAELDCLSGIVEKKKQQLKELDSLAESIFYQMFGDPISNEKGWEVKKLEELCDIINGFAFPSSDFAKCNPIKVIKITNVGVNEFISDDSSLPEEYNNMEGCKVHTGDIVIALTRTIISAGVKRAIVPNEYNESLVNQRVAAILANDRIVSRNFLYSFLGTDFVRQYILQKATALMQPNLSIRDLRDMPTIYPPLALQQEFADKIEEIEKQKELIKQSIIETETLFNARMDYYFN